MTSEEFCKKLNENSHKFSRIDFEKARHKFMEEYAKNFPTLEEQKKENDRINKLIVR